jgi:hypothetical protein
VLPRIVNASLVGILPSIRSIGSIHSFRKKEVGKVRETDRNCQLESRSYHSTLFLYICHILFLCESVYEATATHSLSDFFSRMLVYFAVSSESSTTTYYVYYYYYYSLRSLIIFCTLCVLYRVLYFSSLSLLTSWS